MPGTQAAPSEYQTGSLGRQGHADAGGQQLGLPGLDHLRLEQVSTQVIAGTALGGPAGQDRSFRKSLDEHGLPPLIHKKAHPSRSGSPGDGRT